MNRFVKEENRLLRSGFESCRILSSERSRLNLFRSLSSRSGLRGTVKKRTRWRKSEPKRNQRACQPRRLIARAMVPMLKTALERRRGKSWKKL